MQSHKSAIGPVQITTFAMLVFVACYVTAQFGAPSSAEVVSPAALRNTHSSDSSVVREQARASLLDDNVIASFSVGNALGQKLTTDGCKNVQPARSLRFGLKNIALPTNLNVAYTKAVANLPQAPPFFTE